MITGVCISKYRLGNVSVSRAVVIYGLAMQLGNSRVYDDKACTSPWTRITSHLCSYVLLYSLILWQNLFTKSRQPNSTRNDFFLQRKNPTKPPRNSQQQQKKTKTVQKNMTMTAKTNGRSTPPALTQANTVGPSPQTA